MGEKQRNIEKLKNSIIKIFFAYVIIVTGFRMSGMGRMVSGFIDRRFFRASGVSLGDFIFSALPVAVLCYAAITRLGRGSLRCLKCFSYMALINHVAGLVYSAFSGGIIYMFVVNAKFGMIELSGIVALSVLMAALIARIGRLLREAGNCFHDGGRKWWPAAVVCVVFVISPSFTGKMSSFLSTVRGLLPSSDVRVIQAKECVDVEDGLRYLRPSPDGALIAAISYRHLVVINTKTMEKVFEDTSLHVNAVRFSHDGKYLAAAGRAISDDMGSLALYEVDGFRRVPEVFVPADPDGRKITKVVDVAFRPDDKSLLCVYYSYWDEKQLNKEEWIKIIDENGGSVFEWTQTYCEIDIPSGTIAQERVFEKKWDESIDTFRFSPNAAVLVYVHRFDDEPVYGRRNISFIDTVSWEEKVCYQAPPYRMLALYSDLMESGKLYFKYEHVYFRDIGIGTGVYPRESVIAELDVNNFASRDIISSDIGRRRSDGLKEDTFISIAISPNGKEMAILGTVQEDKRSWSHDQFEFFIVKVSLNGEPDPQLHRYKLGFNDYGVYAIYWFTDRQVMLIAEYGQRRITKSFIVDLKKLEGK